jgi:hypothetical protein
VWESLRRKACVGKLAWESLRGKACVGRLMWEDLCGNGSLTRPVERRSITNDDLETGKPDPLPLGHQ